MGKTSTRKAPGSRARSIAAIASSDAEKNLSLSDFTSTPYAIDRTNDPVRLASRGYIVSLRQCKGCARTDVQTRMLEEALGGLGEPMDEDIYRLVDLVVEVTCSGWVEEAVE